MIKHRIFIVDDHEVTRIGLRHVISSQDDMEVIGEASTIPEAMEALKRLSPDLITIDISMPGGNGLELVRHVRDHYEGIKSLVISVHHEWLFAGRALQAGAQGYIMKEESAPQLAKAMREILAGDIHLSERMVESVTNGEDVSLAVTKTSLEQLTNRELLVFTYFGEGKEVREVAKLLNLSTKTVDTHRSKIKARLGIKTNAGLIAQAVVWRAFEGRDPNNHGIQDVTLGSLGKDSETTTP